MTSIYSKQSIDDALFEDFIEESKRKFKVFTEKGIGYSKSRLSIETVKEGRDKDYEDPSDDMDGSFHVINFRNTAFVDPNPCLNGALDFGHHYSGIAMFTILNGAHTPVLADVYARQKVCNMQLSAKIYSGGDHGIKSFEENVFNKKNLELFMDAVLIGFEKDNFLNHMLVNFSKHKLVTLFFDEQGTCLGKSGVFESYAV